MYLFNGYIQIDTLLCIKSYTLYIKNLDFLDIFKFDSILNIL